jgi:nitroreductase
MNLITETHANLKPRLNVLDAIFERRAVRSYLPQKVSQALVEELLTAATQAPSAMNKQPWSFVIIQQTKMLKRISDQAKRLLLKDPATRAASEHGHTPFNDPDFDIFYGATTLITICGETTGFEPAGDCYLAAQNLMLAAYTLGLATCPVGFARDVLRGDEFENYFGIPENYVPVLPIIVGYAASKTERTIRNPAKILKWMHESQGPSGDL